MKIAHYIPEEGREHSEYVLLIENSIILECCTEMYAYLLNREYKLEVIAHTATYHLKQRHCGLSCVTGVYHEQRCQKVGCLDNY